MFLLAGLTVTRLQAAPISQIYSFGDSRVDVGAAGERYTSQGSLWIESLGARLGHPSTPARLISQDSNGDVVLIPNGGNNYAVGGATVVPNPDRANLEQQITVFNQDHARFARNDLVFIWVGENDLGAASTQPAVYTPNDIPVFLATYEAQLNRLRALGARNVVAFGLPVKLSPDQAIEDVFASGGFDAATTRAYLDAKAAHTAKLDQAARRLLTAQNVYVLDFNKLAEDVRVNVAKYGFLYANDNYQGRGDPTAPDHPETFANDGNVFSANATHYTDAMHQVIADYVAAQLRARDQFTSVLTQSMFNFQQETGASAQANTLSSFLESDSLGRVHQREAGTWKTQAGLTGRSSTEADSGGSDTDLLTGQGGGYVAGDVAMSNDWLLGGRFSFTNSDGRFGDSLSNNKREGEYGSLDQSTAMLSLYAVHRLTDSAYLNTMVSYGATNYDKINRRASLGSVAQEQTQGDTTGDFMSASIGGGFDIPLGNWTVTPNASLSYESISIDGYSERQNVLGLAYGDADYNALRGSLGVRAQLTGGTSKLRPFFGLNVSRDFIADEITVQVGPERASVVDYTTERPNRTLGTASVGANYSLTDNLVLGSTLSFGGNLDGDSSTYLGLSLDVGFSF
jgi:outer membrane lipase/esterase